MSIKPLHELEREAILAAITETRGDVCQAAAKLQIGQTTIYRKLYEYGICVKDRRQRSIAFSSKMEIS